MSLNSLLQKNQYSEEYINQNSSMYKNKNIKLRTVSGNFFNLKGNGLHSKYLSNTQSPNILHYTTYENYEDKRKGFELDSSINPLYKSIYNHSLISSHESKILKNKFKNISLLSSSKTSSIEPKLIMDDKTFSQIQKRIYSKIGSKKKLVILNEKESNLINLKSNIPSYYQINCKGKQYPIKFKCNELNELNVSMYISNVIKRPVKKNAIQIIDKVENKRTYTINLSDENMKKFTNNCIYLGFETKIDIKFQFAFVFGFHQFPSSKHHVNVKRISEFDKVKRTFKISTINDQVKYILDNKDELKNLMDKVAVIRNKRKMNTIKLSNNQNLIQKNLHVKTNLNLSFKERQTRKTIHDIRNMMAEKRRTNEEQFGILKKTVNLHKWELMRIQAKKALDFQSGNNNLKNSKKTLILLSKVLFVTKYLYIKHKEKKKSLLNEIFKKCSTYMILCKLRQRFNKINKDKNMRANLKIKFSFIYFSNIVQFRSEISLIKICTHVCFSVLEIRIMKGYLYKFFSNSKIISKSYSKRMEGFYR